MLDEFGESVSIYDVEGDFCRRHGRMVRFGPGPDLGCPVAVAAARVEAERVAEVEAERQGDSGDEVAERYGGIKVAGVRLTLKEAEFAGQRAADIRRWEGGR